jgi:hypothetical protein
VSDPGGVLIGTAAVITSLATLITTLRTHRAVRTDNGKRIGETVSSIERKVNGK